MIVLTLEEQEIMRRLTTKKVTDEHEFCLLDAYSATSLLRNLHTIKNQRTFKNLCRHNFITFIYCLGFVQQDVICCKISLKESDLPG